MKGLLLQRTGSVPVLNQLVSGSPRVSLSRQDSSGSLSYGSASPRISLHLNVARRTEIGIRRTSSETDLIQSEDKISRSRSRLKTIGSMSMPAIIPETEEENEGESTDHVTNYTADWSRSGIQMEELAFSGGGGGGGGGYGGGGDDDRRKIGANYVEMLKSEPMNPLYLRNYAKFLHEVEGDTARAEEYYGRAILASPGDGEVLSLYGRLIWESTKDGVRAKHYFDRAVDASPNDCTVMGSYAQFMWEADVEDDECDVATGVAMVEAF